MNGRSKVKHNYVKSQLFSHFFNMEPGSANFGTGNTAYKKIYSQDFNNLNVTFYNLYRLNFGTLNLYDNRRI